MSRYSYVQKFALITLLLSLLMAFLCVRSFALPITTSWTIDVYDRYVGDLSELGLYSISKEPSGTRTLVVTDTTPTSSGDGGKAWIIFIPLPVNFIQGETYQINFTVVGRTVSGNTTQITSLAVFFANHDLELLDDGGVMSNSTNVFNKGIKVPDSAQYLVLSVTTLISSSANRSQFYISPVHIDLMNSADMGGSFSDDTPTLPDIDISSSLDDFENSSSTIGELMSTSIASLMPATRKVAQLFSFIYIKVGEYVPALQAVSVLLLSFGIFSVILNIFAFAKSQGVGASGDKPSPKGSPEERRKGFRVINGGKK